MRKKTYYNNIMDKYEISFEEIKNLLESKKGIDVVIAKEKPAWEYV